LQGFELELGSALGFSPAKDSASGEASGAQSFAGFGRQEAGCASCPAFDLGLTRVGFVKNPKPAVYYFATARSRVCFIQAFGYGYRAVARKKGSLTSR